MSAKTWVQQQIDTVPGFREGMEREEKIMGLEDKNEDLSKELVEAVIHLSRLLAVAGEPLDHPGARKVRAQAKDFLDRVGESTVQRRLKEKR